MNRHFLSLILSIFLFSQTIAQQEVRGRVTDRENGESLPFASVQVEDELLGTITDGEGNFSLQIPERFLSKNLEISFLGYETVLIAPTSTQMDIQLRAVDFELEEAVLLPLAPEGYIKRAVRKMRQNFPEKPFESLSVYKERFQENDNHVVSNDAVFKSYFPALKDSINGSHQLLLLRQPDSLSDLEFMTKERRKWAEKAKRKAERKKKKGKPYNEEDLDANEVILESMGGPDDIMSAHLAETLPSSLDSTRFEGFNYAFERSLPYRGDTLMVIAFETNGKFRDPEFDEFKTTQKGLIYLLPEQDAIVAIDWEMELLMSAAIDVALWVFGLSLDDIVIKQEMRYQKFQDKWYPQLFLREVDLRAKRKRLFNKDDKSQFHFNQSLILSEIIIEGATPVDVDKRFNSFKDFDEQIYPIDGVDWKRVNED